MRIEKVCALVVIPACLLLVLSLISAAAAGTSEAVSFMRDNQMDDGGFAEPGRGPNGADATTAWCVMALRASGVDPNGVRKNGSSPMDFLAGQSSNWRSATDYERTLLAVAAGGGNIRSFGGVDLVAKVQSYQRSAGNIGDAVNSNAFGMLAYKAAGITVPAGAVQWHRNAQNSDGGWGNDPGGASNPDMTGASIMALRAAGVAAGDPSIRSALGYLRSIQNSDGGFSFQPGGSDTSATAWCAQAIVAAGQDPAGAEWSKSGNTPLGFLRSMQTSDGGFCWVKGLERNKVWTTAYAICALAGKPFPIGVTYTDQPDEQGGDGVEGQPQDGQPSPPADETGAGQEERDGGADAVEEETALGEESEVAGGDEAARGDEDDAASKQGRTDRGSESGGESDGSSGGASMLWWLIPLAVGVPLLSAAGWYIHRRYAN